MANTASYPIIAPKAGDLLVGTQTYTIADKVVDNPTRNFTVASVASLANSINLGYTVYTALLTQAGTAVPVATVLQNTTGGTIAWTRVSVGRYVATITNATYTANKTSSIVTSGGNNDFMLKPALFSNTTFEFFNLDLSDNQTSDTIAGTTTVEIRIYS